MKKAFGLDDKNPSTNYNLGSLYQLKGSFEEAFAYFNTAYMKEPSSTFLSSLAYCAIQAGKWETACNLYKSLVAIHPEKFNFKMNYLNCCIQIGRYKDGLGIAQKLAKLNPNQLIYKKYCLSL